MSNVINNITKNDTTYAVQDARVDSLKKIFYIEYGTTQWADIVAHYNAGDTLKLKRTLMGAVFNYDLYTYTGAQFVFIGLNEGTSSDGGMIKKITVQLNGSSTFYNESYTYIQNMLEAGSNITISRNPETNKDTISATGTTYTAGANVSINNNVISATDTTYSEATTSAAGLESAADKTKLDGIAAGATAVSVSASGTATDEVQYITVNGVEKKLAGGGQVEIDNKTIKTNQQGKLETYIGGYKETISDGSIPVLSNISSNYELDAYSKDCATAVYNACQVNQTYTTEFSYTIREGTVDPNITSISWQPTNKYDGKIGQLGDLKITCGDNIYDAELYFKTDTGNIHVYLNESLLQVLSTLSLKFTNVAFSYNNYHKIDYNYLDIPLATAKAGWTYMNNLTYVPETTSHTAGLATSVRMFPFTSSQYDDFIRYDLTYDKARLTLANNNALSTLLDAGYNWNIIKENSTYTEDSDYYIFNQINTDVIDNIFDNDEYIPYSSGGRGSYFQINYKVSRSSTYYDNCYLSDTSSEQETTRSTYNSIGHIFISRTTNLSTSAKTYIVKQLKSSVSGTWSPKIIADASTAKQQFSAEFAPIDGTSITINNDGKLQANCNIIPAQPAEDGNYVLKCSIVDGVATYSWEAQS